jgi:YbbR domain-containing protein
MTPTGRGGVLIEGLTVSPQVTSVKVEIEPNIAKKTIEVKPIFIGELPAGKALKVVSFEPAGVEVKDLTGVGSSLEKLEYIYTEPINLSEMSGNTVKVVKVVLPEGLTANPSSVSAQIRVEE